MLYLMCVVTEGPLLSEAPVSSGRILGENGAQKNTRKPHGLGHHFFFSSPQGKISIVCIREYADRGVPNEQPALGSQREVLVP